MRKIEHYHREMQDKELIQVLDTEKFAAFMLRKKDYAGRMCSTMITFTPEGIIIHGDLCPNHPGVISQLGYGLRWFSESMSGGYLCEKFLRHTWVAELAVRDLKAWLEDGGNPYGDKDEPLESDRLEQLQELIDYLEGGDANQYEFYDKLLEIYDPPTYGLSGKMDSIRRYPDIIVDGVPGWGYDPTAAGWLIAIQRRFAELYREMKDVQGVLEEGHSDSNGNG